MKFEQLSNTQKEIDEVSDLELADSFERENERKIKEEIIQSINKIENTHVFSKEFVNSEDLVFFDVKNAGKARYKFGKSNFEKLNENEDEYVLNDFLRGRRTDFVGIYTKKDFEEFMKSGLEERSVFDIYFFDKSLTYDEFVTHKLAHGLFDRRYKDFYGKYKNEISDVSDEYRKKIKDTIIPLVKNKYPNLGVDNFIFDRQQIAEIFAYLYEREFCERSANNIEMHRELDRRVKEFGKEPERFIDNVNKQNNKNFNLTRNVYVVSHTLSFIAAKLLEEEYSVFEERMNIF